MMAEKSKAKWGNCIGYVLMPFPLALQEDPLEYVLQAKATIDRKKHSFEAVLSFGCAQLALKLLGHKVPNLLTIHKCLIHCLPTYGMLFVCWGQVAAPITRRVLCHTTAAFSNVVGPTEEIAFYGHPVAYISPTVYGHPQVNK